MNNSNYSYLKSGSQKRLKNTDFESESEKSLQISQADSGYDDTSLQKPDFILKPRSVEVNEGQSAIFLCRTRGNPPPKIEWKKQGETIHQDSRHKITYGDDCILEIKRTTSRDSGSYTCVLTNPAGTVTMETTLVVKTTKTEQEAPSDFKSTFRRISKQEETKQSTGAKLTNSQDRVEKTISTPVNSERGTIGSRFSPVTQNNPVLQSPGSKPQSSSLSEKIERFQKLEQKSPQSPKGFDFRGVLKPKQNVDSKVKQITSNLGSTDGASRNNRQDVLSQRRQLQQREVIPSRSKTAQDISSPSWKSQSPIQKSGENSAHKSVFNNLAKSETEKVDFRSVLKKKENSSVKEVQSSESSTQNKVQGEIVKEVNNNISSKPEISRWRRDLTTETSVRIQPAGNTVNDRKLIADKLKSETKDQISDKNQTLVKDGNTENDIQHVWSHRKTNNFEQQNQNVKRETPLPGLPHDLPSNKISSKTRARNENYDSLETPKEVKKSPFVSKLQEQTTKQDDNSPNNVYPNDSVTKLEVRSNHEKSNIRNGNVNFRFLGNSKIKEEKEKLAETNQTSEKSVLQEKVKVVSKEKEEISLVDKQNKEPSVNLQKRGSTFESPIKLDVKEDYKSILTKRKSEPDLKEKQLRDLRAIERFSMMSNRKKAEKSENKIPVPESAVNEDVSVGSESSVTPNVKSRGLTMKFNEKEEARGGVGKYQSLNGSIEPGKSNKSSFGSDRKIIDSNIPRDEPRSVLKRRRSSSSFNKNDKLSPTGLDPSADTRLRQPPSFQTVLQNQSVSEGESVTMECHVTGFPKPEVTWYMKDTQIKPSKFFRMTYEDNMARLVIAGAYPEDVGAYSCIATNSSGTERCSCHLFVKECPSTTSNNQSDEEMPPDTPTQRTPLDPPKSLDLDDEDEEEPKTPKLVAPYINEINPTDQTVIAGHKAVFQGSFTSDGKTEVRWYKGTEEIHTCEKRTVSTTEHLSRLTIHNVQPVDGGAYQIVMENKAGSVSAVLSLSVQDVPDPPVGKPYASEVSLYSIILSWCGPAYDGGSQVTGYKVEICKAEEETWDTLSSTCHSTSFSIDNLEAHTPYFFRVSAKNKNGLSKPSEMSNVVVTKDRRRSVRLSVESDDVFLTSPTSSGSLVSPFSTTEEDLPFSPRVINISTTRTFEDDYDLKDGVGKGKFGSVSKCTEKSSGRTFAAKIVKCRSSKEKDNIRQEVEIMNQLTHPKLVLLWDAFETARSMVLVMEYVAGGELFDRVVDEDLELSERDCVHFVRQICEGVQYMHTKSIMHLDLKPENILCVTKDSNLIKIIDFGLARPCKEDEGLRVMFGTPEFIAPEVVNYEVIGLPTDIWSLGVICYVLLSGLSPFMGDSDVETLANVTRGDFDFDDDAFDEISDKAKDFIEKSLQKNKNKRPTVEQCLEHKWLAQAERNSCKKLRQSLRNLKQFMARRKWQKMGNAIRAVGRMSSAMQKLQKSRSDSTSSAKSDSSDNTSQSPIDSSSTVSSTEDKNSDRLSSRDVAAKETPSTNGKTIPKNENSVPSESKVQRDLNKNLTHRQTEIDRDTSKHVNMFSKPVHSEPDPNTYHDKSRTNRESTEKENKQIHNQSFSKREKLKFLKEMVDCDAFEGDIVRFDVQISGDKGLNIEWYYEDTIIHEDSQHSFSEVNSEKGEFSLIIRNVNENNEGEYMCKVIDSSGEITCFAELSVLGSGAF